RRQSRELAGDNKRIGTELLELAGNPPCILDLPPRGPYLLDHAVGQVRPGASTRGIGAIEPPPDDVLDFGCGDLKHEVRLLVKDYLAQNMGSDKGKGEV